MGVGSPVTAALRNNPLDELSTRPSAANMSFYPTGGKCDLFNLTGFWDLERDDFARESCARLSVGREMFCFVEDVSLEVSREVQSQPHLQPFVQQLHGKLRTLQRQRNEFNAALSAWRCLRPSLHVSWRTVRALTLPGRAHLSLEWRHNSRLSQYVPLCWEQLVKSNEERMWAMINVIEHFVFVIPKVISTGPVVVSARPVRAYQDPITLLPPALEHTSTLYHSAAQLSLKLSFSSQQRKIFNAKFALTKSLAVYRPSSSRQEMFFPDRKLVQFDSGKLQTLSVLLRERKQGGHKCLIFTQMSKMLDILEVFLNLHAHTYVRLDGSTGIEKRQKLMDRFNTDPKLFCFILSTRSGGLGINLTGADTVIFYDSDWNPAMDAQAQDRAHRIGQTREVHIYRLVCSNTVEENILTKARQKRHLDYLVMTEGNFSESSIFSTKGLLDVFGDAIKNGTVEGPSSSSSGSMEIDGAGVSSRQQAGGGAGEEGEGGEGRMPDLREVEAAMAAAEDEEDVRAMRGVRSEAAQEMEEFDGDAALGPEDEDDDDGRGEGKAPSSASLLGDKLADGVASTSSTAVVAIIDTATEEKDMEAEFATWQAQVGHDFHSLESALKPVERFALRFRTDIDPFFSIFYFNEQQRLDSLRSEGQELDGHWDVEDIEREKEEEEYRALAEGELLAANLTQEEVLDLQQWYGQERKRRARELQRRKLTGAGWSLVVDDLTQVPFWYNEDTGEASYAQPKIIYENERLERALEIGFAAAPMPIILGILSFLAVFPDRNNARLACARWDEGSRDPCFFKRVLSLESGARDALASSSSSTDNTSSSGNSSIGGSSSGGAGINNSSSSSANSSSSGHTQRGSNKKGILLAENTFATLSAAVCAACAGDTILLNPGHHWDESITISKPLRILGDTEDPARCVVELGGQLRVEQSARAVILSTLALNRPRSRTAGVRKGRGVDPSPYEEGVTSLSSVEAYLTVSGSRLSVRNV